MPLSAAEQAEEGRAKSALEPAKMSTISVSITKGEGGFGMRISVEGVVTGYSVPGGAAEVRTPALRS